MLDKGWGKRIINICKSCYLHIKCFPTNSLAALMWRWCLNSKQAAIQLVVQGSGRCEMGQGETPITWFTRVQWEWYENHGIWHKKVSREKGIKKQLERKLKKYNTRRKNSKYLIILFWLGWGRFLYLIDFGYKGPCLFSRPAASNSAFAMIVATDKIYSLTRFLLCSVVAFVVLVQAAFLFELRFLRNGRFHRRLFRNASRTRQVYIRHRAPIRLRYASRCTHPGAR